MKPVAVRLFVALALVPLVSACIETGSSGSLSGDDPSLDLTLENIFRNARGGALATAISRRRSSRWALNFFAQESAVASTVARSAMYFSSSSRRRSSSRWRYVLATSISTSSKTTARSCRLMCSRMVE